MAHHNWHTLIIAAMDDELKLIRDEPLIKSREPDKESQIKLLQCNIGKVNAAIATEIALQSRLSTMFDDAGQLRAVIIIGTAGSIDPQIQPGDLLITTDTAQHDMDVRALGFQRGQVPFARASGWRASATLIEAAQRAADASQDRFKTHQGRMLTGDRFITDAKEAEELRSFPLHGRCVDMETAAIAQVCTMWNVPWIGLKFVSDGANDRSPQDFQHFLEKTRLNQRDHLIKMLEIVKTG